MNRIAGAGVGGGDLGEMKSLLSFAFLPLKSSSCEVSYSLTVSYSLKERALEVWEV